MLAGWSLASMHMEAKLCMTVFQEINVTTTINAIALTSDTPCQHIQFLYSHGDYRSHGGWYTLVTTTNLSKSSQNGCHWTASSLKKRKRSTCLQEGGLGLRLAPSPDNTIMEIRAQMAVSCCATANLKDWLSNQGNA